MPYRMGGGKAPVPGKTPEDKLRHMIGQLLLTGFSGHRPGDPDVRRIAGDLHGGRLAGALVRGSNIANAVQLRELLAILNDAGGGNTPIIAVEQPGGGDTVLSEEKGFAFYNSANAISSGGNPRQAQHEYRMMADELAALGVTLNIGPSEDVCRRQGVDLSALCFGTSPSTITAFARAFKFGHHDHGVLTALRHVPFRPGLRTTWINERPSTTMLHLLLKAEPSDALFLTVKGLETMRYVDLSLSSIRTPKIRGGRNSFHDAVIFELEMPSGAPAHYGETVVRALRAGADMILIREPSTLPASITALSLEAIQSALKSGQLRMARIEDAYHHARTLKARLQSLPTRARIAAFQAGPAPSSAGDTQ
jgi:beta-glucosidase-like glycosyl hydrolase